MISDKTFKSLPHSSKGFEKYLNGQQIEIEYKPDFVLKKGNEFIILESENSSSRKMYVGGMLKAAYFLQKKRVGILVFVIKPKINTKVSSIAKHLGPYFNWMKDNTNLSDVYVIDEKHYFKNNITLSIRGEEFASAAIKV